MATSTEPLIVYDKKELASFARVIRSMSEIAVDETKRRVGELAQRELNEIRSVAKSRGKVADRVAQGGKVKKSSLLGEISFGFASQRFSGGATTQFNTRNDPKGNGKGIGAASEFGSGNIHNSLDGLGQCLKGRVQEVGLFIQQLDIYSQPLLKSLRI